jgi:hypothetical protein
VSAQKRVVGLAVVEPLKQAYRVVAAAAAGAWGGRGWLTPCCRHVALGCGQRSQRAPPCCQHITQAVESRRRTARSRQLLPAHRSSSRSRGSRCCGLACSAAAAGACWSSGGRCRQARACCQTPLPSRLRALAAAAAAASRRTAAPTACCWLQEPCRWRQRPRRRLPMKARRRPASSSSRACRRRRRVCSHPCSSRTRAAAKRRQQQQQQSLGSGLVAAATAAAAGACASTGASR